MGLSLDKKLLEWAAFHGDIRATRALDSMSVWNLPLKRWAYGFSAGSELKLSTNSSFNLQVGGSLHAACTHWNDRVRQGIRRHHLRSGPPVPRWLAVCDRAFLRARENLNLPFRVRWNTDPDLSIGSKPPFIRTSRCMPRRNVARTGAGDADGSEVATLQPSREPLHVWKDALVARAARRHSTRSPTMRRDRTASQAEPSHHRDRLLPRDDMGTRR